MVQHRRRRKGFTIVELTVVVLLLGILAATALPRFTAVTTQAHDTVAQGAQSGLQTAVAMFHANWVARGRPGEGAAVPGFGSGQLWPSVAGYPKGTILAGITHDAAGAAQCAVLYDLLQQNGVPPVDPIGTTTLPTATQLNAETDAFIPYVSAPGVCNYVYAGEGVAVGGSARVITYDSTSGIVSLGLTTALP